MLALDNQGHDFTFLIESQMTVENVKLIKTEISNNIETKEAVETAFCCLGSNSFKITNNIHLQQNNFVGNVINLNNLDMTSVLTLSTYITP